MNTQNTQDLALLCAGAALDKKGENVHVLDVRGLCSFADYFVIASAYSSPQVQAMADHIKTTLKTQAEPRMPLAVEGYSEARWLLMDYGSVVVHIFLDAIRDYYKLEELWSEGKRVTIPAELYGTSARTAATTVSAP